MLNSYDNYLLLLFIHAENNCIILNKQLEIAFPCVCSYPAFPTAIWHCFQGQNLRFQRFHHAPRRFRLLQCLSNISVNAVQVMQRAVLFRPIEKLLPGDLVFFVNPWETLVYKVVETKIISPGDIQDILIQPGKDLLTLLTCAYPNDQRVLVLCERTEDAACEKETVFARGTVLRKTRPWDWFRTIWESPCGYFTK